MKLPPPPMPPRRPRPEPAKRCKTTGAMPASRTWPTQYGIDAAKLAKIPSRKCWTCLLESIDQKAFQAGQTAAKPADGGSPKAAEPAAADATQQATDDALSLVESMKLGDADGNLALEDREPIEKAFKAMAAEIKEMRQFAPASSSSRSSSRAKRPSPS